MLSSGEEGSEWGKCSLKTVAFVGEQLSWLSQYDNNWEMGVGPLGEFSLMMEKQVTCWKGWQIIKTIVAMD